VKSCIREAHQKMKIKNHRDFSELSWRFKLKFYIKLRINHSNDNGKSCQLFQSSKNIIYQPLLSENAYLQNK
jgi:hypothetical protein